ncbi:MAG: hypothetical protein ACK4NY_15770 [Spirosomataceae bacterium]
MKKVLLFAILLMGCEQKEVAADSLASVAGACSYDGRKTVEVLKNVEAVIQIVENFTFIVPKGDQNKRYLACNLPDNLKEGQRVAFDADVKEIFPNERWAGVPIKITKFTIQE